MAFRILSVTQRTFLFGSFYAWTCSCYSKQKELVCLQLLLEVSETWRLLFSFSFSSDGQTEQQVIQTWNLINITLNDTTFIWQTLLSRVAYNRMRHSCSSTVWEPEVSSRCWNLYVAVVLVIVSSPCLSGWIWAQLISRWRYSKGRCMNIARGPYKY